VIQSVDLRNRLWKITGANESHGIKMHHNYVVICIGQLGLAAASANAKSPISLDV
jgi:hypothetical protein